MDKKFNRDFLKILFVIIAPILVLTVFFSFYLFDRLTNDKKTFFLKKTCSMASLISSVAEFDEKHLINQEFDNKASRL